MTDIVRHRPLDPTIARNLQLLGEQENSRPTVVRPVDGDDISRLSAEAVHAQYEQVAKGIEEMGELVRDFALKLENEMVEYDANLKLLADAARTIREKGHHTSALIERSSAVTRELRSTLQALIEKVG
jgi:methyl-accepting chemotaxis protein